jgi:hypothetical protein
MKSAGLNPHPSAGSAPTTRAPGGLPGNGIDGETGTYLFPPRSPNEILDLARSELFRSEHTDSRGRGRRARPEFLGPIDTVDPADLDAAGWGVIFPAGANPRIEEALKPLLSRRAEQAGERFRALVYHPGESKQVFLARYGAGPGPVDPRHVPYYLLIVGGPGEIPFSFQYQLDVQYAVGRLHFDGPHRPAKYARYAQSVIESEDGAFHTARRAVLFGPCHPDDPVTQLTHDCLLHPLAEELTSRLESEACGWNLCTVTGPDAGKERLLGLLGGEEKPALLFTAGHGVGFRRNDRRQRLEQGALVSQDWKGPGSGISPECYVSAQDLSGEGEPQGLLAFHFGCYSAATPADNNFLHRGDHEPRTLARTSFVAGLPQRLLSHPNGGALAVVGHVDRAWGYSFYWPLAHQQLQVFADALHRLLQGDRLGWALEPFNLRYAELASDVLQQPAAGNQEDLLQEAALWTALLDARNYVILGDPAVRLATAKVKSAA